MKKIFKFNNKYYDYKTQKIMFQLAKRNKFKKLSDEYVGKYFFGYLYPGYGYSPLIKDYILTDTYEDDEGCTSSEYYYDYTWIYANGHQYIEIHIKDMKQIKILDKFPREGTDWNGPDHSKCFGWTGVTYNEYNYSCIDVNHYY